MKFILLALVFIASGFAQAKTIEITVPDDTFIYDDISVNFDGSVSIESPKVYANGEYLPFINSTYGYTRTASIACALFGFSGRDSYLTDRKAHEDDGEFVAHLGYTRERGIFLAGVYNIVPSHNIVTHLLCKQLKNGGE